MKNPVRYIHLLRYVLDAYAKWLQDYPAPPKDKPSDTGNDYHEPVKVWDNETQSWK